MDIKLSDAEKIKILNGDDLYGIMQKILLRENKIDRNREHFWVVGLENNNRILFIELVSLGTVNKSLAEPMEVFSLALQKRAVKIILVHNHPSGELLPSESDKDVTDRLIQVGKIVNTPIVDHLIITETSFYSFTFMGLLKQLEQSTRYVPQYQIEQRIKKEAVQIAKEKTEKELLKSKKQVAKKLKSRGVDNLTIVETTGLSLREVEAIKASK